MPQMAREIEALAGPHPSRAALSTLTALRRLQALLPEYEAEPAVGMQFGEQNKYVTWRFDPVRYKSLELLHITDAQFGHVECQVDRIIEYRDWVLAKPNRFVFFGGDMIDAATIMSPGSPWENICGPQSQVYKFVELVAPMRHRILGYVGGNHERRGLKTFGDLGILIATLLRVPYSGGRQLVDIYYGNWRPFTVDLWHGKGAAQTKGAKVMMLYKYMNEHPGSHLYLVGHLHDCFILPCVREVRLPHKNNVKIEKYYGGMSSSFLNHWGTYAEVMGLSITDVMMLRTTLEPGGKSEMTIR